MSKVSSILALMLLIALSCEGPDTTSEPITFDVLLGTYTANFGSAKKDEIILRSDSTYRHVYISSDGESKTDEGQFQFIDLGRQRYRTVMSQFVNFLPNDDRCIGEDLPIDSSEQVSRISLRVVKSRDRIILEYCWNEFKYYIRQLNQD